MDIIALIKDYGFPVVAVFFLAYFIGSYTTISCVKLNLNLQKHPQHS